MRTVVAPLLAGAFLSVCFLPLPLAGLLVVPALALLFSFARREVGSRGKRRPGSTWLTGYLYGIGFFLGLFHWIPKLKSDSLVYEWIMWPSLLLMSLYLAIYAGAAFWVACRLARRGLPVEIGLPAAWVLAEWARGQGVLGFTWGAVGYALADLPILIQPLELVGLYGLSFLVLLVAGRLSTASARSLGAGGAVIVLLLLYGAVRMRAAPPEASLDVALIQPNLSAEEKWDDGSADRIVEGYLEQSARVVPDRADLVVWPETAVPLRLRYYPNYVRAINTFIERHADALLTGAPDYDEVDGLGVHYNAAFLFDFRGEPLQRYVKRQLVPFSEWLPWRFLRVMEINFGQADFTPGRHATPLRCGDHAAGVLICIEAIFPQLARASVREGADVLINITNDVWFGNTAAPYEHAAMARTRAVELRRPLVRCANTGVSMIVDRAGRISRRLGMSERGEIRALVHPERTMTPYARFGDWIVAVAALVLLAALVPILRRVRLRRHADGRILARRR